MYYPKTFLLLKAVISTVFMWIHVIKSELAEKNICWLWKFFVSYWWLATLKTIRIVETEQKQ